MLPEQHGTLTGEHPSAPRWESSQPKMPMATCWRKVQPLVQRTPLHLYPLFFLTQVYTLCDKASQDQGMTQICLCTKEGAPNFSFFQHPVTRPMSPCLGTEAQLSWLACWEMNPNPFLLSQPWSPLQVRRSKISMLGSPGFSQAKTPGAPVRRADPLSKESESRFGWYQLSPSTKKACWKRNSSSSRLSRAQWSNRNWSWKELKKCSLSSVNEQRHQAELEEVEKEARPGAMSELWV